MYKSILVTGGGGFLGRHVVNFLVESEYNVRCPSSQDYDLTKFEDVDLLFGNYDFDAVIHLAANVGGIGANMERPADFLHDNAMMGLNMMKAASEYGIKKFVQIGTVCSYPKHCPTPFKEEDFWNGYPEETNAPYGIAKKMLLTYGQALRKQKDFNSIYLIPTNLYGPGDNFNADRSHVIPALIKKIHNAIRKDRDTIEIWGDGTATRQFLYVEDCAEGIVKALEVYDGEEPINLAYGCEQTIEWVALMIAYKMKYKGRLVFDRTKPNGQPRRLVDTTRQKELLDFTPKIGIMQGLDRTIKWYLDNQPEEYIE